jgi:hypothetical protein
MSYMLAARPGTRAGETRSLGDWPPLRPSGPEPGSADGPPWPMPYSGFGAEGEASGSSTLKIVAVAGLALLAGWWLGSRKSARAAAPRARGRGRSRGRRSRRRGRRR